MLDRSKRFRFVFDIYIGGNWLEIGVTILFTYITRDFSLRRFTRRYWLSRREFNIEKKKNSRNFSNFHEKLRNFAPDFLERAKLSRKKRRRRRDTPLDSSRSSARRSNNSDWNPRNRGSIERFSIKRRNKVSFYRWWRWSSRVAPPRHGITLLHINESGPSAHKIRTNER